MQFRLRQAAAFAAIAVLAASAGWATSLVELSSAQLTERSQVIAHGRCIKVESQWIGNTLMTLATIEVVDTLKGQTNNELTLVLPGGIDTERAVPVAVTYPGAPSIWSSEEVFLFLEPFEGIAGSYWPVGFSQGKLRVMRDTSGTAMVVGGRRTTSSALPLEQLKGEIRAHLETLR